MLLRVPYVFQRGTFDPSPTQPPELLRAVGAVIVLYYRHVSRLKPQR